MQQKSTLELAKRFNEIMVEMDRLEIEHELIVKELWRRYPHLQDNVDIQPKKLERKRLPNYGEEYKSMD